MMMIMMKMVMIVMMVMNCPLTTDYHIIIIMSIVLGGILDTTRESNSLLQWGRQ